MLTIFLKRMNKKKWAWNFKMMQIYRSLRSYHMLVFCYCPLKAVLNIYFLRVLCRPYWSTHTHLQTHRIFTLHDVQIDKMLWIHVFLCTQLVDWKTNVFNSKWRDQISNAAHLHSRISKTTANYYITAVKCAWQKRNTHSNKNNKNNKPTNKNKAQKANEAKEWKKQNDKDAKSIGENSKMCHLHVSAMVKYRWANILCELSEFQVR